MVSRYVLFLVSVLLVKNCFSQTPDIIVTNGKIFTSDEKQLYAEALAIKGNRIIAVGKKNEIEKLAKPSTKVMNHPFHPVEALTREEAVIAYTSGSAYAEMKDDKGMLVAGQLADLVVLSDDVFSIPLQQLPSTHSWLTMVDGKIIYNTLKK